MIACQTSFCLLTKARCVHFFSFIVALTIFVFIELVMLSLKSNKEIFHLIDKQKQIYEYEMTAYEVHNMKCSWINNMKMLTICSHGGFGQNVTYVVFGIKQIVCNKAMKYLYAGSLNIQMHCTHILLIFHISMNYLWISMYFTVNRNAILHENSTFK